MFERRLTAPTPIADLVARQPDIPVHYFAPTVLADTAARFRAGFAGLVTYAVKANPAPEVLRALGAAGITGFDVASPEEIALVARVCPGAALHYNNPVRSRSEIAAGVAAGVVSWSVDDPGELAKLAAGGATGEVAVRFKLAVRGAAYDFGAKFGASEAEAATLLARVAALGFTPALTFHVGTQCTDPAAWTAYMAAAARISRAAGVPIARLNVGGGFPASRDGAPVDLAPFFAAIHAGLTAFDTPPALVCEPGRGMVADAFSYAVRVKSLRAGRAYLNDGIYGGLSEVPSMGVSACSVVAPDGTVRRGPPASRTVFGPTCDSLDQFPAPLPLPGDMAEGDWIVFRSMGAYLNGVTTRFNGYGARQTVRVSGV